MPPDQTDWGDYLANSVPRPWAAQLGGETLQRIRAIGRQLSQRVGTERIVPAPPDVFRALSLEPAQVRVLLIGQDPYPSPGHAMGLSFSVPRGTSPLPPSARNIQRELVGDLAITPPSHFDLSSWASQGVLLLNRALTTAEGRPGAHHKLGWSQVTDRIVEVAHEASPSMVAIIWGGPAGEVAAQFDANSVIRSAHPSPLSAHRGFFGSKPFSRANALLVARGVNPIDWSLSEGGDDA